MVIALRKSLSALPFLFYSLLCRHVQLLFSPLPLNLHKFILARPTIGVTAQAELECIYCSFPRLPIIMAVANFYAIDWRSDQVRPIRNGCKNFLHLRDAFSLQPKVKEHTRGKATLNTLCFSYLPWKHYSKRLWGINRGQWAQSNFDFVSTFHRSEKHRSSFAIIQKQTCLWSRSSLTSSWYKMYTIPGINQ